ncbi:kinase-like domain-containing protein [Delphinella strobiligena]|nr:kinase-like domain-containing protein [Delphinella strobiligena]
MTEVKGPPRPEKKELSALDVLNQLSSPKGQGPPTSTLGLRAATFNGSGNNTKESTSGGKSPVDSAVSAKKETSALDVLSQLSSPKTQNLPASSPSSRAATFNGSGNNTKQSKSGTRTPTDKDATRNKSTDNVLKWAGSLAPLRRPTPENASKRDTSDSGRGRPKLNLHQLSHRHRQRGRDAAVDRRRSHSAESVRFTEGSLGLLTPHSPRSAAAGMGTKSRRLSSALPPDFLVDHCPLDKEYTSIHMIRRRKERIGEGGFAQVILMRRKGGHRTDFYAVKQFRGPQEGEPTKDYIHKIKSEYSIGHACDHDNIIKCVRLCNNGEQWSQVMEFCDGGSLYDIIDNKLLTDMGAIHCIFKQLLRGVDYLHSHGIAHRDIKPENLLLTRQGCLKIIDFGLSEVFSGLHPGLRGGGECGVDMGEVRLSSPSLYGSEPYKSHEVEEAKDDFDPRGLDVWSCAIMLMVMIFKKHPWVRAVEEDPRFKKFWVGWQTWLEEHPDGVIEPGSDDYPSCGAIFNALHSPTKERLVLRMLHPDPSKRISIAVALQTNAVQSWECCQDGGTCSHEHGQLPKEHGNTSKLYKLLHRGAESPV